MTLRAGYIVTSPGRLGQPSVLLCDNIDPKTHDYASLFTTIDPIDAQVILALTITRASGTSVVENGHRLREITKMTESSQSEIRSLVREALSQLITRRDIQYKGVTFDPWDTANQTGTAIVQWINLRARDRAIRTHPLQIPGAT